MATLTKSTGTVTLSGAVEKVTLPAAYGWVWLKNMSDADMFAGLSADISEGADGVMVIPAGECGRIQTDGQDSVYLIGTGNALVVAQNYADCPFKLGAKGGEIPDLSVYAKTADVPNIKVNSAVDADTVDGFPAATFMRYEATIQLLTSINDMMTAGTYGVFSATPDFPTGYGAWGFLEVRRFGSICYQTIIFDTGKVITRARTNDYAWTEWHEPYTNIDKPYVTGSVSVSYSTESQSFEILDFTPSAVICKYASRYENDGTIKWATPITNGFAVTVDSTEATSMSYIAFK